jgi:hypothetical protein
VELIAILRLLWRRRLLVALAAVASAGCGMVLGSGPTQVVGVGSSRLVVNTPQSQVVDASSTNKQTLVNHAPMLADLLATAGPRERIAQLLGIPVKQLSVIDKRLTSPNIGTPLPTGAADAALATGAPYSLLLNPYQGPVPIVEFDVQAPTVTGARRLLDAAGSVLEETVKTPTPGPDGNLRVSVISAPHVRQVEHGPRKIYKIAGTFVVFVLLSTIVLLLPKRRGRTRRPFNARRLLPLGVCGLIGLVAALISLSTISVFPPHFQKRDLSVATAETHLLIDTPPPSAPNLAPYSAILNPATLPQDVEAITTRATLFAGLLTSEPVVKDMASHAGVSPDAIYAYQSPTPNVPVALSEPTSEKRSYELANLRRPYLLEIQARPQYPIIDIYAQAPTPLEAQRLADASVQGLQDYIRSVASAHGETSAADKIRLLELGEPQGAMITTGTKLVAGLSFFAAFIVSWCGLLLLRRWRRWRAGEPLDRPRAARRLAVPQRLRQVGDWPRTTRVLPWMLAFFIAMLWLVPFEQIQLNVSLPIGLPLDRLILPFLIGVWILALRTGGRAAPRLRLTWIHGAVGAFMTVALLSVVLNAPDLNHTQEFMEGLKRIPLFMSYLSLFVIVASVVRPGEVRAFLNFMLGLSLILAVGMIVEYRSAFNVFYDLSAKLMPGFFTVGGTIGGTDNAAAVDSIGRRLVQGSAGHPLEAVAMLSIALAIALVGLTETKRLAHRAGYSVAVCLLLAAMVATFRKSALLAPLSVLLTVTLFRPRQMLRMAPLGLLLLAGVHVIAPGAFGSVTEQLNGSRLNVPTVSDRVVRYDAVRPDVWSHLLFGRGLGTYDHVAHRILDSEFLGRLIETGVFGLITYFSMVVSTVVEARRVIQRADPAKVSLALMCAAAAVSFGVLTFMYDTLSFPHGPYLFLCVAGMVAVLTERTPEAEPETAARRLPGRQRVGPSSRRTAHPRERLHPGLAVGEPGIGAVGPERAGDGHGRSTQRRRRAQPRVPRLRRRSQRD